MGWIYLLIAGLTEIAYTTFLKLSNNFTVLWPSIVFIILAIVSLLFLSLSLKSIPLGTAYAVWTGIGAFGTAIMGIIFFQEPTEPLRIIFLVLLISAIIGLKIVSH
jgi:quaternary ammonium compound-resistance protein SugE